MTKSDIMASGVQPLVTIIIPAFNAGAFLSHAVESACAQTYRNIEILVVDDGSSDNTQAIAQELARRDPRVRLLAHAVNCGVSAARNLGLREAKGDWIAILDADDRFQPERLEHLVRFAEAHDLDLAADNLALVDYLTEAPLGLAFPDAWMEQATDADMLYLLEHDIPGRFRREIGFMKPIIRTRFLREKNIEYDRSVWAGEDFLLYAECLLKGARLRFVNEPLYVYHWRPGSASSGKNANIELVKVNDKLMRAIGRDDARLFSLLKLRRILLHYEIFIWHVRNFRVAKALFLIPLMPPSFLCKRLGLALLRRIARPAGGVRPTRAAAL